VISYSFLLAGFDIIAGSVCQAIGNPVHTLIISVCRQLLVLLPVAWLLAQTGRLDLVWFAYPISEVISLILSIFFLRRTFRAADARFANLNETP
ncbi:MAG: MATE family efflux transporter, partial [Oscillibacter sp.]|nr:MATE family efflux transporter [Oscillibacter sp.]